MFWKHYRTLITGATAAVSVWVFATWGESTETQYLTIVLIIAVTLVAEYLQRWATVNVGWVRHVADPRSRMIGPWIQIVTEDYGENKPPHNVFSIFFVEFTDEYHVSGKAYNELGMASAEWWSAREPSIGADGRSMSYVWTGTRRFEQGDSADDAPASHKRDGLTELRVLPNGRGSGLVQNVHELRSFAFDVHRIDRSFLRRENLNDQFTVKSVIDNRDEFAETYARKQALHS